MDKLKKLLKYIKENKQKLFCYLLIFLGILLAIIVFFKKPHKLNIEYLHDTSIDIEDALVDTNFPIVQHIKVSNDMLYGFYVYFGSDDINEFPYTITLKDKKGKEYFNHKFNLDYSSNIIYMQIPLIKKSKGKEFIVTIDCNECNNVKVAYMNSKDNKSYIENNSDKTLGVSVSYYTKNNSYYWYSLLMIVIGVTLLPLARRTSNDNK